MGHPPHGRGLSRRSFLLGTGVGLAAGGSLAWLGLRTLNGRSAGGRFTGRTAEVPHPELAMPGRFPGRVVEIRFAGAVDDQTNAARPEAVRAMVGRGMTELTGADHAREAWASFFGLGDVVGIKVNPVGLKRRGDVVGVISSPALLIEVVEGLKTAGVRPRDIIVLERYASEFREAGYEEVLRVRALDGVRWVAASQGFDPTQLGIDGYAAGTADRDAHVVGYDPDVFVDMGFCQPDHDPQDDRRFRSHMSLAITRMINKLVTIPVLKDHRSAGVTLSLKNLSHGLNNNVARSHFPAMGRLGGATSAPNQCDTFIPTAAGQRLLRQKATLHILDGLVGAYEGGPGSWNPTWATWRRQSLFFATDPVALDHVGWDIIDARRTREGWPPVARMGTLHRTPSTEIAGRLRGLGARLLMEAVALAPVVESCPGSQEAEQFDRRQPEHIILAGSVGLGVFDAGHIEHRVVQLKVS